MLLHSGKGCWSAVLVLEATLERFIEAISKGGVTAENWWTCGRASMPRSEKTRSGWWFSEVKVALNWRFLGHQRQRCTGSKRGYGDIKNECPQH